MAIEIKLPLMSAMPRWSIAYWMTAPMLMSLKATTLATLRWMNNSPGPQPKILALKEVSILDLLFLGPGTVALQ